jgi:hypothetical protein
LAILSCALDCNIVVILILNIYDNFKITMKSK